MVRPFEGVRVIDLTHVLAGPFATYQLAVLGADVIKVEAPDDPDQARFYGSDKELARQGLGTSFLAQGSNKRTLALDLKSEKGREVLKRLVKTADVMAENYRPGAFKELGLGYEDMAKINPRLIYCSMSAYGHDGPRSHQTGYDNVIQASAGLMTLTGTPASTPMKFGTQAIDYSTGIMGAFAIASALFQRTHTDRGQWIDLSMFDTALVLANAHITSYLRTGGEPKLYGNDHADAGSSCFQAKEGLIMMGAGNFRQKKRMWAALGRQDMVEYHELRVPDRDREMAVLTEELAKRTADEWEVFFNERGVAASRVRTLVEAMRDPQVENRPIVHERAGMLGDTRNFGCVMSAFRLDHGGPSIDRAPARVGEHTDELLKELGYGSAEIAALHAAKVV